jgi:hypothetical protein
MAIPMDTTIHITDTVTATGEGITDEEDTEAVGMGGTAGTAAVVAVMAAAGMVAVAMVVADKGFGWKNILPAIRGKGLYPCRLRLTTVVATGDAAITALRL